jgi:hypothetical protein
LSGRLIAFVFVVASCGGPQGVATLPRVVGPQRDALPVAPDRRAVWEVIPAGGVAGDVRDVGALSGGDAVVVTERSIVVWTPAGVVATACQPSVEEDDFVGVQADGDRFVVVAGTEGRAVLWRSVDRGVHCERVTPPTVALRDTDVGRVGFSLHGERVHLWSTGGGVLRSDDTGLTWRRLPTLRGVAEVAPGPGDRTLAAAIIGSWGERRRLALHVLAEGGRSWEPVAGAEHLRGPVTIARGDDGSALVGDSAGTVWIPQDLARERVERRYDLAARDDRYAPGILATAGDGAFVAASGAVLTRVERRATTALAALPGARPIRAIDAARDGWWWATDGRGLWRSRGDESLQAATTPPLQGEEPAALAVRDGRVLIAGAGRAAAVREGATGAWRELALPEGMGRPVAAHIDERGGLFVLTTSGLAVSDAMRFVALPAPSVPVGVPARLATLGDRWLIGSVAAYVSDDHGGRWDVRFGQTFERPLVIHPHEDVNLQVALGYAFARDQVLVVDTSRTLSRADALGAHFERFAALPGEGEGRRPYLAQAIVAWDGGARVAVLAGGAAHVSRDGGESFTASPMPFVPRWAGWSDGVLVASGAVSHLLPPACRGDLRQSLFVETQAGWVPDPQACEQRGSLVAQDGDDLWMVDASLTLRRASLARLVRAVAGATR